MDNELYLLGKDWTGRRVEQIIRQSDSQTIVVINLNNGNVIVADPQMKITEIFTIDTNADIMPQLLGKIRYAMNIRLEDHPEYVAA